MDINNLDTLYQCAAIGSIKKAAEMLNFSPSGLIYTLNSVEKEMGVILLIRDSKGIRLSKDGLELAPYVEKVIESYKKMILYRDKHIKGEAPSLTVATYQIILKSRLSGVLAGMRDMYPNIEISLFTDHKEFTAQMEHGVIDVAIVEKRLCKDYTWYPLEKEELMVAAPDSFGFRTGAPVSYSQLEKHNLIYPAFNKAMLGVVPELSAFLNRMKSEKSCMMVERGGGLDLLELVSDNCGYTFISSLYERAVVPTVKLYHLETPIIREIGLAVNPDSNRREVKSFCAQVKKKYKNMRNDQKLTSIYEKL